MKMIILGAGVAGSMASAFFRSHSPEVFDQRSPGSSDHKAIFRIKNPEVGLLLGCPLEKVKLTKSIYRDGVHYNKTNIALSNEYSVKVTGGLSDRSITELGDDTERYIPTEDFTPREVQYDQQLYKVENGKALFHHTNGSNWGVEYDVCISTIPMSLIVDIIFPRILDAVDMEGVFLDKTNPIMVTRWRINFPSKVVQTIYFPDPAIKTYRATIENQDLIVESFGSHPDLDEMIMVMKAFGISGREMDVSVVKQTRQKYGKINCIDEEVRKAFIYELTEKHNIYSLGRFAVWKNLKADDLLPDLRRISELIKLPTMTAKYNRKIDLNKEDV